MKVSAEVEIACSFAQREAISRRHDVMAVEHLLYGLLHDEATAKVVKKSGGKVEKLKRALERILSEEFKPVGGDAPVQDVAGRNEREWPIALPEPKRERSLQIQRDLAAVNAQSQRLIASRREHCRAADQCLHGSERQ